MRKSYISLAAAGLVALALAGCAVEELVAPAGNEAPAAKTLTVNFTTRPSDTKTAFTAYDETAETYPVVWTAADSKIGMSLNYGSPVEATVVKEETVSDHADFTATFEDNGTPYRFFGFSPSSAAKAVSESRTGWAVTIPTVQTPRADGLSCDEKAMLLYAETAEMTALPTTPIQLNFDHVTSYCRLILKNLEDALSDYDAEDAEVNSVDVTYSVPVAGDWYVTAADGTITAKEVSHTITLLPTIDDLSQPAELWFALAPCTLDGQTVKVTVNTDKGRLIREFTYGTRTYVAGAVNKLTLDMTKNTEFVKSQEVVYELLTSVSDLAAGDQVIILDAKDPSYGMTASTASTASKGFVSVAKSSDTGFSYNSTAATVSLPETSSVAIWTVDSKSGSSVTLKIVVGSTTKYLATNTSSNTHYPQLSTAAGKAFTLDIADGVTNLWYSSKSGSTWYSLYCDDSHYFNINSATKLSGVKKELAIFRKVEKISAPEDDAVLQKEEFGAYLASGETLYVPGASQLSREYEAISTTFAVLYPSDNAVLQFSGIPSGAAKGDSFSLVVIRTVGGKKTTVGTYNVTVVKEEGAKLWLSDFSGNGFIVKR